MKKILSLAMMFMSTASMLFSTSCSSTDVEPTPEPKPLTPITLAVSGSDGKIIVVEGQDVKKTITIKSETAVDREVVLTLALNATAVTKADEYATLSKNQVAIPAGSTEATVEVTFPSSKYPENTAEMAIKVSATTATEKVTLTPDNTTFNVKGKNGEEKPIEDVKISLSPVAKTVAVNGVDVEETVTITLDKVATTDVVVDLVVSNPLMGGKVGVLSASSVTIAKGAKEGTATITFATADFLAEVSAVVTVTGSTKTADFVMDTKATSVFTVAGPTTVIVPVTDVTLNKKAVTLQLGATITTTLVATVFPENATSKSISWTTSNKEVANIDINGVVTAYKAGETTITVASVGSPHMAVCVVTVLKSDLGIDIPDANFKQALIEAGVDLNNDGGISKNEAEQVKKLALESKKIQSLEGIQYFKNITELNVNKNLIKGELNFSNNTALTVLYCSDNAGITGIDVSQNTALTSFICYGTQISTLDISNNIALTSLNCSSTQITKLDVSSHIALKKLICSYTGITELNVSNNLALTDLSCMKLAIKTLDISKNLALNALSCSDTKITELNISNNKELSNLICYNIDISILDVSKATKMVRLNCCHTKISSLILNNCPVLRTLLCNDSQMSTILDISKNTKLTTMNCINNENLSVVKVWSSFDPANYYGFKKPGNATYIK
ncbi:MAG: Ig-like domain-containing protein [Bacteroidetes bacterium]|nr:Ig-like domain-containing protein [Bacteroidota bacterium]